MLKKLGKMLINNIGLKVLAVVFAIVLWIVVVNINNPVIVQSFTTSVTAENTSYITAQNKYYEVLDGENTVTFNVSAERSILAELSNSDFSAVADMEKIEYNEGNDTYRVPVTVTANRYSNSVTITSRQLYMQVTLEDLGTSQKVITAATRGTVADGCALGNLQIVGSNLLRISGPYSIVSQIDTAVATINIDGLSTDVTDSVVPMLYDADGNVIDTTKLRLSQSTVTISAQILNTKDVSLDFQTSGEPAEGYVVTGVTYNPETVRIKGEAATLNPINKITIPEEVLDVTGRMEDVTTTVDISTYLPTGTALVLASDATVEVTVHIEPLSVRTFNLPVSGIVLDNLSDSYALTYGQRVVTVEVEGAESEVRTLRAADITLTANFRGLSAGEHELNLSVSVDSENCWGSGQVSVPVTLTRRPGTNPPNTENDTNGGEDASETPDDTVDGAAEPDASSDGTLDTDGQ